MKEEYTNQAEQYATSRHLVLPEDGEPSTRLSDEDVEYLRANLDDFIRSEATASGNYERVHSIAYMNSVIADLVGSGITPDEILSNVSSEIIFGGIIHNGSQASLLNMGADLQILVDRAMSGGNDPRFNPSSILNFRDSLQEAGLDLDTKLLIDASSLGDILMYRLHTAEDLDTEYIRHKILTDIEESKQANGSYDEMLNHCGFDNFIEIFGIDHMQLLIDSDQISPAFLLYFVKELRKLDLKVDIESLLGKVDHDYLCSRLGNLLEYGVDPNKIVQVLPLRYYIGNHWMTDLISSGASGDLLLDKMENVEQIEDSIDNLIDAVVGLDKLILRLGQNKVNVHYRLLLDLGADPEHIRSALYYPAMIDEPKSETEEKISYRLKIMKYRLATDKFMDSVDLRMLFGLDGQVCELKYDVVLELRYDEDKKIREGYISQFIEYDMIDEIIAKIHPIDLVRNFKELLGATKMPDELLSRLYSCSEEPRISKLIQDNLKTLLERNVDISIPSL